MATGMNTAMKTNVEVMIAEVIPDMASMVAI